MTSPGRGRRSSAGSSGRSSARSSARSARGSGGRAAAERGLTVAVTGPTGTFGMGLVPQLEADERIGTVVGIARRPFDPAEHGWTKLEYRRGDVRDSAALREAFAGADVVVHLAFMITGNASRQTTRSINVDGTLNAFRAAADAGAKRFVYASSVAAYGWHPDNPPLLTEDWPVRPAARLFYGQEKAELEQLLQAAAEDTPGVDLYLLRPCVVLGPNTLGAKDVLPGPLAPLGRRLFGRPRRLPVPVPVPAPELPLQFVHEDDVGQALLQCILGEGPPGAYNIAGDGILTFGDVVHEFGGVPVRLPAAPAQLAARLTARWPLLPPAVEWVEAVSRPSLMDTTRAKEQLGWRPRYTGLESLRDTLRSGG